MMALLLNANDSVSRSYSITKPSPLHPIVPSECGEKTENLIDDYLDQAYIDLSAQGVVSSYSSIDLALFPIEQGSAYTIQRYKSYMELYVGFFVSKPVIGSVTYDQTIHAPSPFTAATFTFVAPITGWAAVRSSRNILPKLTVCVAKGSTAPTSYIPYGYKLPLTSAGQSVDIYLGESQTTRRIKKLVLTGEEYWTKFESTGAVTFYIKVPDGTSDIVLSTHFSAIRYGGLPLNNGVLYNGTTNKNMLFRMGDDTTITDVTSFKSFLAAQYAAGTPVTVWYVLAEPETGIVNEPLCKIGDYADTIDSTQTTAQIPTSANSTTISWDGEGLAPSQVELEYEKRR